MWQKRLCFSSFFLIFAYNGTRIQQKLTINWQPRDPPQLNFGNQFTCITWVKLRVFVLKHATSGPHLTFFMNIMQLPGPDLQYHAVPCAVCSDGETFIWSSPIFGREMLQKSQKYQGPPQYKSGPSNTMLVSRSNLLLYHFSTTIFSTSLVLREKKIPKNN